MVVAGEKVEISLRQNTMRTGLLIVALTGLVACAPQVPESGVGFQDYNSYLREREVQATTASSQPTNILLPTGPQTAPVSGFSADSAAAAIDRADGVATTTATTQLPTTTTTYAPIEGERPRGNAPAGIKEEFGEVAGNSARISDENDFDAVSARETIESDAARIELNRSQYVVVQPGALPVRPGDTGPNIVAYALATNNAPGVALYSRSGRGNNSAAACARYGSPDIAQEAFLELGGPDRDRKGLDPDGDGFACSWDPRPFRTALQ
jgi:hypothetical protein